jgi:recombination protein RecA
MLKKEEIKSIIDKITKDYGEGTITTLGIDQEKERKILSSGSLILDSIIGGGYGLGRIIEIYGEEASGKTTLALQAVAECQKLDKKVAYIDLENALDVKYAKNIGVKIDELLIVYSKNGEEALDLTAKLIENKVDLIIVDSVAALTPKAEIEGDLEKQIIGSQARMMSAGLRKINWALSNKDSIVIFINQIRNKISTGYFAGNPETTSGGKALGYFASLRLRLKEKEKIEKNNQYVGIKVLIKVKKNKLFAPYQEGIVEIMFAKGIQKEREVIDLAIEKNIIAKSGNWFSYKDTKMGNGKENVLAYLLNNPETYKAVLGSLMS